MLPDLQETTDLITFTKKLRYEKLQFLYSAWPDELKTPTNLNVKYLLHF